MVPTHGRSVRPSSSPLRRLHVGLAFGSHADGTPIPERPLGTLAEDGPTIYFEYDPTFIAASLPVSPLHTPVQSGLFTHTHPDFDRLPGLIADSAPDGWGRTVQDRAFAAPGIDRQRLTIFDRLAAVGSAAMGALTFRPAEPLEDAASEAGTGWLDLSRLAAQAIRVYDGSTEALLPALRLAAGSPGGARPKVLAGLTERADGQLDLIAGVTRDLLTGHTSALPAEYTPWLIKFGAGADAQRFGREVGAVEAAYAEMARRAGLNVPPTRLLRAQDGERHFAVQRFDRFGPGGIGRKHMLTAGGLLHASFREPSLDYTALLQLGQVLTGSVPTLLEILRRAAFNVFTHNRDDHARNFSFLMDDTGRWSFSPAYDLMYSDGLNGHHTTSIANESLTPGRAHLERLAASRDLPMAEVRVVIDQVIDQVGQWPSVAASLEIAPRVIGQLEQIFTRVRRVSEGALATPSAASRRRAR